MTWFNALLAGLPRKPTELVAIGLAVAAALYVSALVVFIALTAGRLEHHAGRMGDSRPGSEDRMRTP